MVSSLIMVTVLPRTSDPTTVARKSTSGMNDLIIALRQFQVANGRLPCPADASKPTGDANYGLEATGNTTALNCTGGTPAANYSDASNHVAIGMLPVRSLNLPNPSALDGYQRTITYAVDTNATTCGWSTNTLPGTITVTNNGSDTASVIALVSHGDDGHGAWLPLAGSSGTAARMNAGSTDADELTNAHVDSSFTATTTLNHFINKIPTATFHNLVTFRKDGWSFNKLPAAVPSVSTLTPPADGTYATGQNLTFVVNFTSATTVNTTGGTPYIALSAISGSVGSGNLAKASYLSGSGTTALTFRYTVISSDSAPSGTSITSPIVSNGGTIKSGNMCAGLGYTAPDLSRVKIGAKSMYVADYANNRIQVFDATGTFKSKITMPQLSGESQVPGPSGVAVDASGNIWVGDQSNYEIKEYDSSGTLLQRFGSYGTSGAAKFASQTSLVFDSGNNLLVLDLANDTIQKFNSSGTWIATYSGPGSANGQLSSPKAIALDASDNIYVADTANTRIVKFNSSGVWQNNIIGGANGSNIIAVDTSGNIWVNFQNYIQKYNQSGTLLTQFGGNGSTNGLFQSPSGIAIDANGNLWIGDNTGRIQEFSSTGTYITQFGTSGSGNSQFNNAKQMTIH